ncbi:MAG: efflux RND transporter periplasmic adaptor subunit [Elusimicrobiota bacterium]|nr:MAG: efflux RND transporter periplasmic adaptor subunit [Elusimicrobiota bacterium]
MRPLLAAALLLISAAASRAATAHKVKRGDLEIRVKVTGTVIPDDIFRIKATIEGRVESVLTSTFVWRGADQPLAFLAHKELAAMLDSKGTQQVDILEDRWQRVYRPTAARCPDTCYILKNFLKPKAWVKPESVMFEAAATLKLVGRVRPEDAPWIKDGQELRFWPVNDPKRVLKGRVTRYILDIQGEKVEPGGTFTLLMSPLRYFDPGTEWEGEIVPLSKKDVLYVPTSALVRGPEGGVYLPVRVSTGITTEGLTQITAGAEQHKEILVLDDAQLRGAARHKQEADAAALRRMARRQAGEADFTEPELGPVPESGKKKGKHAVVIEDDTDYGEDPYAEPQ